MEDENKRKTNIVTILRWIGVLPTSVAASFLADIISRGIGNYQKWFIGSEPGTFSLIDIAIFITVNVAIGIAWVYLGSLMAPCYRKIVSIILTVLLSMILAVAFFITFTIDGFSLHHISMILVLVSAIVVCVKINDGSIGFSGDK